MSLKRFRLKLLGADVVISALSLYLVAFVDVSFVHIAWRVLVMALNMLFWSIPRLELLMYVISLDIGFSIGL